MESDAVVISYQRGALASGTFSFKQAVNVLFKGLSVLYARLQRRQSIVAVYLVISSTLVGNMRDLFLIALLGKQLRTKLVIHFHGARFAQFLEEAPKPLFLLNKMLLGSAKAAIVVSPSLRDSFEPILPATRVHAVPNFADEEMFVPIEVLESKHQTASRPKFLFLSNLIRSKGYDILLEAFLSLPYYLRKQAELHFAGRFDETEDYESFLQRVETNANVMYHRTVTGKSKTALFASSHVFCLPTSYPFEAQPISLLEAYASGCAVITSDYGVLGDVFKDGVNGYRINRRRQFVVDIELVQKALTACIEDPFATVRFGQHNREHAESNYRVQRYGTEIRNIVLGTN